MKMGKNKTVRFQIFILNSLILQVFFFGTDFNKYFLMFNGFRFSFPKKF